MKIDIDNTFYGVHFLYCKLIETEYSKLKSQA